MNLHLHKVISDLSGQTGISIIEAILRGERSPQKLAEYRHSRIRCSSEELRTALEGSYQDTYLFELQQAYDLFRFYEQKIQECDDQLEKQLNSYQKKTEEKPPSSKKESRKKEIVLNLIPVLIYFKSMESISLKLTVSKLKQDSLFYLK